MTNLLTKYPTALAPTQGTQVRIINDPDGTPVEGRASAENISLEALETIYGWPDWYARSHVTIILSEDGSTLTVQSNFPGALHRLSNQLPWSPGQDVVASPDPITITVAATDYSGDFVRTAGESYEHLCFVSDAATGSIASNVVRNYIAVPPALTNGSATSITSNSANLNFETDFLSRPCPYARYDPGSTPSAQEIAAGGGTGFQGGTGSHNPTDGTETFAVSLPAPSTNYRFAITQDTSGNAGAAYADPLYIDVMSASDTAQVTYTVLSGSPLNSATGNNTLSQVYTVSSLPDGTQLIFFSYHTDTHTNNPFTAFSISVDGSPGTLAERAAPIMETDGTTVGALAIHSWTKTAGASSVTFQWTSDSNASRRGLAAVYLANDDLAASGPVAVGRTPTGANGGTSVQMSGSMATADDGIALVAAITHGNGSGNESFSNGVTEVAGHGSQVGSTPTRFSLAAGDTTGASITPQLNSANTQAILMMRAITIGPA